MPGSEDLRDIEIRVIQDVIDTVDRRLRHHERNGSQILTARSHIYATVLYAVITSSRKLCYRATLDGADILDTLLDEGDLDEDQRPLDDLIRAYVTKAN